MALGTETNDDSVTKRKGVSFKNYEHPEVDNYDEARQRWFDAADYYGSNEANNLTLVAGEMIAGVKEADADGEPEDLLRSVANVVTGSQDFEELKEVIDEVAEDED